MKFHLGRVYFFFLIVINKMWFEFLLFFLFCFIIISISYNVCLLFIKWSLLSFSLLGSFFLLKVIFSLSPLVVSLSSFACSIGNYTLVFVSIALLVFAHKVAHPVYLFFFFLNSRDRHSRFAALVQIRRLCWRACPCVVRYFRVRRRQVFETL